MIISLLLLQCDHQHIIYKGEFFHGYLVIVLLSMLCSVTVAIFSCGSLMSFLVVAKVFCTSEWCKEYASNYPNPKKLQKEIDEFMEQFDKKQEEVLSLFRYSSPCHVMLCYSVKHLCLNLLMQEKEEAKRLQSEPDDEGWITIGKGGRKPGASKVDASELLEKKKKKQKVGIKGCIRGW